MSYKFEFNFPVRSSRNSILIGEWNRGENEVSKARRVLQLASYRDAVDVFFDR